MFWRIEKLNVEYLDIKEREIGGSNCCFGVVGIKEVVDIIKI